MTLLGSQAYKDGYYAGHGDLPESDRLKDYCHGVGWYGKKFGWSKVNEYGSYPDYQRGYAEGVEHKARVNEHLRQMRERLKMSNNNGDTVPIHQGESMTTRNPNRGYEIAARLVDNYEGKQDMDSNTWNDLVVRLGDAINQAKVGAGIRRIAEAEGVIETEETE